MRSLGFFLNNLGRLQSIGNFGSRIEHAVGYCTPISLTPDVVIVWIMRKKVGVRQKISYESNVSDC